MNRIKSTQRILKQYSKTRNLIKPSIASYHQSGNLLHNISGSYIYQHNHVNTSNNNLVNLYSISNSPTQNVLSKYYHQLLLQRDTQDSSDKDTEQSKGDEEDHEKDDEVNEKVEPQEEEKTIEEVLQNRTALTPAQIVSELNRYIIGQQDAKRAVAIALRNRWRRQQLSEEMRDEVTPKNILMIGPTGIGKTEIARRLSKLADAPFVKVEATKFTEVGFHGRDVDSIIKDLMDIGVQHTRDRLRRLYSKYARERAEDRIIESKLGTNIRSSSSKSSSKQKDVRDATHALARELRQQLQDGDLDEEEVEIDLPVERGTRGQGGAAGAQGGGALGGGSGGGQFTMGDLQDFLSPFFSGSQRTKRKRLKIKDALPKLEEMEIEKLLSSETVTKETLRSVEQDGIVFVDEIDKVCSKYNEGHDASSEGVQRDLLPLIEGTTISTKYGNVKTDHILFVCCGAFHNVKPSDMISELQGRLPIRVELKSLTRQDLLKILTEPENSIIKQHCELLKTEGIDLEFTDDGIHEIARVADEINNTVENIGARRLITVVEKILEDISYHAPEMSGEKISIDEDHVQKHVGDLLKKSDLKKFIL